MEALWQILWLNPVVTPDFSKSGDGPSAMKRQLMEFLQHRVCVVASELMSQETVDHLVYPNPGSEPVHDQHLQNFHFLGNILAKAMFKGILVDIPFATFFLSKLKQNTLPPREFESPLPP